jgi:hypothetical protein
MNRSGYNLVSLADIGNGRKIIEQLLLNICININCIMQNAILQGEIGIL